MDIAMPEAFFSAAAWSCKKASKFSSTASSQTVGLGLRRGNCDISVANNRATQGVGRDSIMCSLAWAHRETNIMLEIVS